MSSFASHGHDEGEYELLASLELQSARMARLFQERGSGRVVASSSGPEDQIIPGSLTEKNFEAYTNKASITEVEIFPGRSHYICNEPGWERVADYALAFIEKHAALSQRYPSL